MWDTQYSLLVEDFQLTYKSDRSKRVLERAIRRKRAQVERYLASRVRNPDDAWDLAQEAFLRLLRLKDAEYIQQPEAYLFRIAINLAYEYRLKRKTSPIDPYSVVEEDSDALATPHTTEELADLRERMERLEQALRTLAPNVRAALLYHRRDGMTYGEIAERLGVSTSMVKKYLQTALIRCRDYLRDWNDDGTR